MSRISKLLVAVSLVAAVAALLCNELIVDFRAPRSELMQHTALGASAYLSLVEYNKKVTRVKAEYGARGHVILDPSAGKLTVKVGDDVIEESQVERVFASMHGLFVIGARDDVESIFPFDIEPGKIPPRFDREPNIGRLQARFGDRVPAKYLAFDNSDWTRGSCALPQVGELGFAQVDKWLGLRAATSCVVHWNGATPRSMLILVLLADADPWMRPFARRICRTTIARAIEKPAVSGDTLPDYAACVLVDRPVRTGPSGAQDAFISVVFEVRSGVLARLE